MSLSGKGSIRKAVCLLLSLALFSGSGQAQERGRPALSTNLLYDAVAIPNIGVELSL